MGERGVREEKERCEDEACSGVLYSNDEWWMIKKERLQKRDRVQPRINVTTTHDMDNAHVYI